MSLIYQKEMTEGVRSSRKIFGIPIYQREDSPQGEITRKYLMGVWKTSANIIWKQYYFLGIRIFKKQRMEKWDIEQCRRIEALECAMNEQKAEVQKALKSMSQMHNKLNKIFAETSNIKTIIQCQELHKQTFGPYKNCMLGKTVVLVASGPTVKYHHPIKGAIYVGVNNACALENVSFDYLFCQDFYMDEEKRLNIAKYRGEACQKFFGRIPDKRMEHCRTTPGAQHVRRAPRYLVDMANAKEYYVCDYQISNIAYDIELEPLHPGGIAFSAMQFILHCHPSRIYIVGCDCSAGFFYQSDITFDNSWMIKIWREFKIYIDELYPDIKVISLNPVGLRGIFEDHYSDDYLKEVEI